MLFLLHFHDVEAQIVAVSSEKAMCTVMSCITWDGRPLGNLEGRSLGYWGWDTFPPQCFPSQGAEFCGRPKPIDHSPGILIQRNMPFLVLIHANLRSVQLPYTGPAQNHTATWRTCGHRPTPDAPKDLHATRGARFHSRAHASRCINHQYTRAC